MGVELREQSVNRLTLSRLQDGGHELWSVAVLDVKLSDVRGIPLNRGVHESFIGLGSQEDRGTQVVDRLVLQLLRKPLAHIRREITCVEDDKPLRSECSDRHSLRHLEMGTHSTD